MIVVKNWLKERLPIEDIIHLLEKKEVPIHKHSVWYYFGGMALFLFMIQVVTGILLLFYYKPSAETAFESVQYIMTEVSFGWLIRSIHSWSANILIAVLFIHLFSVFFLKSYRKPREITWISGCLLFFIALAFGFTGYLLPWNKLAVFATKVGTEITGAVPVVGKWLLRFLRGGEEVTGSTLNRFFAVHVAILPVMLFILCGLHLYLVQKHGMSIPLSLEGKSYKTMKFFPHFLLRDLVGWLCALGVLAFLSALFPWELGEKADLFEPAPAGIKPEWYFLFMFQTLKMLPAKIGFIDGEIVGIVGFGLVGLLLILVPFLDRKSNKGEKNLLLNILGIIALIYITLFTIMGYFK